jgi:hypothetical protein
VWEFKLGSKSNGGEIRKKEVGEQGMKGVG